MSGPDCLVLLQGLTLRGQGWNPKAEDIMVQVVDDGRCQDCTVVDLGASAAYSGTPPRCPNSD